MTTEEIKKIVDDEHAEQLTAQLCRHWEVAAQRLEGLVQELAAGMDTCVEAELYAALMRMQSSVMALMELNKIPCTFLFSEYLDRVCKVMENDSITQSAAALFDLIPAEKPTQQGTFFDHVTEWLTQYYALPTTQQDGIRQLSAPLENILPFFYSLLPAEELIQWGQDIQKMKPIDENREESVNSLEEMRQSLDGLSKMMGENLSTMLMGLFVLTQLPKLIIGLMQQSRTDSKAMAGLFNKVLARVRDSSNWWNYWKDRHETLLVVYDGLSTKDIMKEEQGKERAELGKVAGGLFAKWTTDRKAFEADFLDARLSDDDLRLFIFHLTALYEIARELNPTTKYGEEQLVRNETQQVGDAVLEAALKLQDLTDKAWFPHYEEMWQELIQNEEIFARLKVTRQSPHNNLFTARFFCHLVGEMKKSAVFGPHSDYDLAEKLTEKRSVGTFRKNIQEGMGEESKSLQKFFDTIYQKYKALAHPKK
ncbi:MAG: hypothetical protein J5797_04880 [Prevotella sp.]|nr:hypothetical protein [Prevotella sp.]